MNCLSELGVSDSASFFIVLPPCGFMAGSFGETCSIMETQTHCKFKDSCMNFAIEERRGEIVCIESSDFIASSSEGEEHFSNNFSLVVF